MGAKQRRAVSSCRVCGATTNHGKAWCSLHHPKKGTTPHRDKYAAAAAIVQTKS
jgi:hypothetical protein